MMMTEKRITIVLQTLGSFLLVGLHIANAQTPGSARTATLNVEAREVVLDVVVTDKNGIFVSGLGKEDFVVLEDKVKQRIASFQPPSMHTMPQDMPEVRSTSDLRTIGDAPVTILVLDELNTQFADMAYARGALQKWLDSQPMRLAQPTELMVANDKNFSVLQDFTQNRAALLVALKQHFPSYPFSMSKGGSIGPSAGERMALSLGTLIQIAEASSGTPGRKNVIWIGVGFPQMLLDDTSGSKEDEITRVAVHATNAMLRDRVTLNVIDPTAMADSSVDMNNLEYLTLDSQQSIMGATIAKVPGVLSFDTFAPATGGSLFTGRNDVEHEIEQAIDEGSTYYTITYSPTNHNDDAVKFRNITIVMRDPTLKAATRSGYFPELQANPSEAPTPPTTHDLAFDLTNAALSSMVYNGIRADAQKTSEGYLIHALGADLKPHELNDGTDIAEVTVMQVCFGNKNKVLSHDTFELKSRLDQTNTSSKYVDFTVPKVNISPYTRRIRLVIRDAISGRIGTIDIVNPQ